VGWPSDGVEVEGKEPRVKKKGRFGGPERYRECATTDGEVRVGRWGAADRDMSAIEGRWRITGTDLWCDDDLDLLGEAEIVFDRDGIGSIQVGALQAELDYRFDRAARPPRADFTWSGVDEMDPVSGRGWVLLEGASLRGKLFIHMGDDVVFSAAREDSKRRRSRKTNG
jgi:hypothetical protein